MRRRILDLKISSSFDKDGHEIKNIRFEYGALKIDVSLNEQQTNKLLRAIIKEKSEYYLEVRNFQIPALPNDRRKIYFEINEDTFHPRTVDY